ncbi:unnamed protein product, partial [Timema podura]|nr:unnamed protein product [Timema podura]
AGSGIGAPSVSKEESTLKSKNSAPGIATLASSKQEVTVKREHSVNKDQEMATLSTSEHEITVKQEHSDEKAREMMTLQSDKQENPCGLEHLFDPTLSPWFLTGPFGRLVVVDEFTTNYQKILTTTASSNKIILARQFGRMPSGIIISLNNQLLATGKGASQVIAAADAAQQSVKILQQHYYTIK